jgi:hypothetical protein
MSRRRKLIYAAFFALVALVTWALNGTPRIDQFRPNPLVVAAFATALVMLIIEHKRVARETHPKHLCRHCGPDCTGLADSAACPECGAGKRSVCACCHADMTGIEHRACPECGVMYGVERISRN